jgi:hypothetical protein
MLRNAGASIKFCSITWFRDLSIVRVVEISALKKRLCLVEMTRILIICAESRLRIG